MLSLIRVLVFSLKLVYHFGLLDGEQREAHSR